ncbi:MAG: ribonuclease HII [Spirochaetales bacterium]|nr:ribonuclease HII [Spirochaetales bacterium]
MDVRRGVLVCGIDEAGRGPLAGPVTAACVILGTHFPPGAVADSKILSKAAREKAFQLIQNQALAIGIGWSWPREIDEINILQASLLAMRRAYDAMKRTAEYAYVDGNQWPNLAIPGEAVVRGDSLIPCISAASIVAKVARDHWMTRWSWIDDRYAFEKHMGYPTLLHKSLITIHGRSEIHRKSFKFKNEK